MKIFKSRIKITFTKMIYVTKYFIYVHELLILSETRLE